MSSAQPSVLNVGIVAHVDAGKTSLTERLLFEAGVVGSPGSVDAGTTRTDSMALERRRGITIRAAVTSFVLGDLDVNLVDTPGHPDFIAEVERSLGVLDAAVLVLSAVEDVQPQTVVIWRALQRIGVPTVLFVNKVDRAGADVDGVLERVRRRLTPSVVELAQALDQGRHAVRVVAVPYTDESVVAVAAEVDEKVLVRWVAGEPACRRDVVRALRHGVRRGALTPAVCGSAITGAGLPELRRVLTEILPRASRPAGPVAGTVFAVDRDERGRRAWVRLWAGELRVRDRVAIGGARPVPVTELAVSNPGGAAVDAVARAGQIAAMRGPAARIGDTLGQPPGRRTHRFAPATVQALVQPVDPAQRSALFAGLTELADEDPLIELHLDETDGEASVRLHGEVQKEDQGGRQPLPCRDRPACRGSTGRAWHRVLVRRRARKSAPGVRRRDRGGRAVGTEPGTVRVGRDRLRRHDDGVRLLPAAEQAAPDVRQVELQRGRGLPQPRPGSRAGGAETGRDTRVPAGRPVRA